MTDEELREQVATTNRHYLELLKARTDYTLEMIMPEWADQILTLIKQNYVRLAKDQSFPFRPYDPEKYTDKEIALLRMAYSEGQQDMWDKGSRRIEEDL